MRQARGGRARRVWSRTVLRRWAALASMVALVLVAQPVAGAPVVVNCASPPAVGTPMSGYNVIVATPGVNTAGTPGNDLIYGTPGPDRIAGLGGDDIIYGLGGNDQLSGGDGDDTLCGGDGDDDLAGGDGDDLLVGGPGADRLSGGLGFDTCTPGGQPGDAAAPPPSCDVVTSPDTTLEILKSGPTGAFPNQQFDFTITVRNTGSSPATGVEVVDTLPASGSFVSSSLPGSPPAPAPGGTYTIALPDIPVGGEQEVTIRWQAPPGEATLVNSASASAANAPAVGPASATVPVGIGTTCNPCGVAAAGTGLRNRDQGTITIAGIPAGATVARAVLVWGVLYDPPQPRNTITFAGNPVVADVTATVSGTLCWNDDATVGYAADVTPYVTGNGSYVVSDPPRGITRVDANPFGSLPYTDGASLIVFYVGGGANSQVISDFSYDTNTDADGRIVRTFTGVNSVGGAASVVLAGPDGQGNAGEPWAFVGSGTINVNDLFNGSDPQLGGPFSGGYGTLWDTDRVDVSSILPAGQSTLTVRVVGGSDCIGVGAAVLEVAQ